MSKPFITKSKFRLALECPTKLYYNLRPEVYANESANDPFLRALAEGGFQVGELAKIQFGPGFEITESSNSKSLLDTETALKDEKYDTLFEPAFSNGSCLVRVDVLKKGNGYFEIFEVKSKSADSKNPPRFLQNRRNALLQDQRLNICDVAFQTYVARQALRTERVAPRLVYIDTNAKSSACGIHQNFRLTKDKFGKAKVIFESDTPKELVEKSLLLTIIDVSDVVDAILANQVVIYEDKVRGELYFKDFLLLIESSIARSEKIAPSLNVGCRDCEYKCNPWQSSSKLKSGFHECWAKVLESPCDETRTVLSVWNARTKQKWLDDGVFLMSQLHKENFIPSGSEPRDKELSDGERQWIQIEKTLSGDNTAFISKNSLQDRIKKLVYPLHFIDFETTRVAIPFFKGGRPYEQLAFQFSHHILYQDGTVEHRGQFFFDRAGEVPNFEFVRALKKELSEDNGSILRFAAHENTVLREIFFQLYNSNETDRSELMAWINSVTTWHNEDKERCSGERNMIDMLEIVRKTYYSPIMAGSNSIKAVLPAVLFHSQFLKEKYSKPIYGTFTGIKSLNFKDWAWLRQSATGEIINPYKLLPQIFSEEEMHFIESRFGENELREGGTAMMAYARMQFSDMTDLERSRLREALLRYCELDTLSMVMIMEYWLYEVLL